MEDSNIHVGDRNYLARQRSKLMAQVKNIDNFLEDYRQMLRAAFKSPADYSLDTLLHVEVLLMTIKPTFEKDEDVLVESAFYIGETLRRAYKARWDVSDDEDHQPDAYGTPMITGHSLYEDFLPFEELDRFLAAPREGYFLDAIKNQISPR